MGWKEYKANLGIKHTFEEFDCKEFYVVLRRVDSFAYGEAEGLGGRGADPAALLKDPKLAKEAREDTEKVLRDCILEWNLTDPEKPEIDEALPLPKQDSESLARLPMEFIAQMFFWLAEDSKLAKLVPKEIGTLSGQH